MANTKFSALTALTAPAPGDGLFILDDYGATPLERMITLQNMLKVINGLTEDTGPDRTADYVVSYDASASAAKKVLIKNTGAYTLQFTSLTIDPADGTTYYAGGYVAAPTTTALRRRIYIPRAGIITAAYVDCTVTGTLATTENTTFAIRLNNTTDTTISSTAQLTSANNLFSNTALTTAVAAGDYIEIKIVTPTWATNPTGVQISGTIFIS